MNVLQRLNEVRKEIAYIKRDAAVQNYTAVTHDMVTAATREAMIKHGVLTSISLHTGTTSDVTTSNGKQVVRYDATYNVTFHNIEQPDDFLSVRIPAHANDFGDKSPPKATSMAMKIAILKVLMLETGDDEESRVAEVELLNSDQIKRINDLINEKKIVTSEFHAWINKAYGVDDISKLPSKSYDRIIAAMERRK